MPRFLRDGVRVPRSTSGRIALRAAAAALAATLLAGCAAPPRRPAPRPEELPPGVGIPFPGAPPPRAPEAPPVVAPPEEPPAGRPIRVRLDGIGTEVLLEGGTVRVWGADGSLLAEEGGAVKASALGGRILWRPDGGAAGPADGKGRVLESPVDVGSTPGIRIGGKAYPGRVRLAARDGRLSAVAVVPLEEYVAAVVSREGAPSFHPEALAALAVAVRTYALDAIGRPRDASYDVVAGVEDQVFEGIDRVAPRFRDAAEATRGMAIRHHGAFARAVYHSTCGGKTENASDAWGRDVPYLRSVPCDDCLDSPVRRWEYRMGNAEGRRVALALGVRPASGLSFEVVGWSKTGRAARIRLSSGGVSRETSAASFRQAAGYAKVRSLKMRIVGTGDGWLFSGEGYGHGVGMCQWGANGMAKSGKGHREILARYYPGTVLSGEGR